MQPCASPDPVLSARRSGPGLLGEAVRTTCAFALSLTLACASAAAEPEFRFGDGRLTVTTPSLELVVEAGAVVGLRHLAQDQALAQGAAWPGLGQVPSGFTAASDWWPFREYWRRGQAVGYAADPKCQAPRRRPAQGGACEFRLLAPDQAEITYSGLTGGQTGDRLQLSIRVDAATGDVLIEASATAATVDAAPACLDLPLLNLTPTAVILGSGARYTRTEPPAIDCTTRVANGLYSPNVALLETERGTISCWAEPPCGDTATVWLAHTPEADTVILSTSVRYGGRAQGEDPAALRSVTWRVAAFPNWLGAARRYRGYFEQRSGAKPLWENACPWVRDLHAVVTQVAPADTARAFYEQLAALLPPQNVLLFYWNGDGIVLFGDHRYQAKTPRPPEPVVDELCRQGFRWLGYHPYVLLMSPAAQATRLQDLAARSEVPAGYGFRPDFEGEPAAFHDHFRPVAGGYHRSLDQADLWVLHPGARLTRDYLVRNFGNYCREHRLSGAYLDILGCTGSGHFSADRKIMDGCDWSAGETGLLAALRAAHPGLACMSEYQTEWVIPGVFYSWAGSGNVVRQAEVGTRLNHPLRTALWGSYTWTRDEELDPEDAALIGALPHVTVGNDWQVARARLFIEEQLFNDLPDEWPPDALACYRGRNGRQLQFRRLPCGDGFAEVTAAGVDLRLGRFIGQEQSPLTRPARIQGWVGYREQRPIGLSPDRAYPFEIEPPQPTDPLWVTDLPAGVFIRGVRHLKTHTVVEFGTTTGTAVSGKASLRFQQPCLRVADSATEWAGPFAAGAEVALATSFPGGLVAVWAEPEVVDTRFRGSLLQGSAHFLATGAPDALWCYNQRVHCAPAAAGGVEHPTIQVGYGRYRGLAEAWVAVAPASEPVLRFQLAYAPSIADARQRQLTRPLRCAAQVNGTEVWQAPVSVGAAWQPVVVPLSAYRGRKVLVSLSAEAVTARDVPATHTDSPAWFGAAFVDDNPVRQVPPDGVALPRPATVWFADAFAGPQLEPGWSVHISPAHLGKGAISAEGGRLVLSGQHYRHLYIARPLPPQAAGEFSVQVRLRVAPTGCAPGWNPGLGLLWAQGQCTFVSAGSHGPGEEVLAVRGWGARQVPLPRGAVRVGADSRYDLWLRIGLTADALAFSTSVDGKTWESQHRVPRQGDILAAPTALVLGRGNVGPGPLFSNDERWETNVTTAFLSELVVGTE